MRFSLKAAKKFEADGMFDYLYSRSILDPVYYIIDSKYRTSKYLVSWIKHQVDNPSTTLKAVCSKIKTTKNPDLQIKHIQNYVVKRMRYIGDTKKWGIPEYWQPANQTVRDFEGDCEDGAIFMYVLARMKGIPANRLMLMAGNVFARTAAKTGGHAWLAYKPFRYPLNWTIIDWCYAPDLQSIDDSNKYIIQGKMIKSLIKEIPYTWYYYIWFAFNEEVSFRELRTKK